MGSLDYYGIGFLVFGGKDKTTIYSDAVFYNLGLNEWIDYSTEYVLSFPRFGSCMISYGLKFFIIGGETDSQISREVIIYDFSIDQGIPTDYKLPLEITGFSCVGKIINDNFQVIIVGGRNVQDLPENKIIKINISTSKSGKLSLNHIIYNIDDILLPSHSALIYDNNWIHLFGGVFSSNVVSSSIISLNLENNETMWNKFSHTIGLFSHTAVQYLDEVYIFGGVKGASGARIMNYGGNTIYKFKFDQKILNLTCLNGKKENTCTLCEVGTFYYNGYCIPCNAGKYSDIKGASSFLRCSYCKYGTYNDKVGSRFCKECTSDKICFIGSKTPKKYEDVQENASIQPENFDSGTGKQNDIMYKVIGLTILCSFILIIILLSADRFRALMLIVDIFIDRHDNPVNKPVMFKKTLIGGIFSSLFIIFALLTIIFGLYSFFVGNVSEYKTLVPTITLTDIITSETFTLSVKLHNYGSICTTNGACMITIIKGNAGIEYKSETSTCYLLQDDCIYQITYKDLTLLSSGNISLYFTDISSFATSISLNISSSSSIPGQSSAIMLHQSPSTKTLIFKGANPSIFKFELIPSVSLI